MPQHSKRIIAVSVSLLAVGVIGLTAMLAWNSYTGFSAAQRAARINAMADTLIRATVLGAYERGLVAAALGGPKPVNASLRQKILDRRTRMIAAWDAAQAAVRSVEHDWPDHAGRAAVLQHLATAYQALERRRQQVDRYLQRNGKAVTLNEWLDTYREFMLATGRVRDMAFALGDLPTEVAQHNLIIKHRTWVMSEFAGQERATFAYFLSAGQPVPAAVLSDLRAREGVIRHTSLNSQNLRDNPGVDDRIRQALANMELEFGARFRQTREAVYAAAATGRYPLSATAWLESATGAIDSILGVVDATTQVVSEKLDQTMERARRTMTIQFAMVVAAFLLAGVSVRRAWQTANALFHEKELAEVTLHSIGDAVVTTDAAGNVRGLNPIAETLTGWSAAEARGQPLPKVFNIINGVTREPQPNPVERCLRENRIVGLENNTVLISRDGRERVIEDSAAPVRDEDGAVVGAVMVFYDVTLMRDSPHLLSHQATHDSLTGLVNRREFERRLTMLVEKAKTQNSHHVLCYLDLDQFKIVNDTCGHIAGDKLLRQLSFLLKARIREADTLARLGGDEFGILLETCQIEPALRVMDDVVRIVNDFHFVWNSTTFEIGVSIGMVPIAPDSVSPGELLSQADAACYAAKDKGRNRVQVYQSDDAELQQRQGEMRWVPRLREAIENDRFVLYCHPILPLVPGHDGRRYCETLLRLRDETGAIIPPMAFIPAAERYNLMPTIDRWVIRQTIANFGKHCCGKGPATDCFINLSGSSLSERHLFEFIRDQLQMHNMKPESICFEITETAAVAHLDTAVAFMKQLKDIGCRFALDDFGSGMSSFAYLKNLPVDYIKIGGTFVQNIAHNPSDCAMVDAIHRVGRVMGIKTIAEYVESEAILEKLREIQVDFAQGFAIARPLPMTEHLNPNC